MSMVIEDDRYFSPSYKTYFIYLKKSLIDADKIIYCSTYTIMILFKDVLFISKWIYFNLPSGAFSNALFIYMYM